ncbi:DUF3806 domain-containing protein [Congregibacter brevis]|uniref:DUF3806 domain-containing protein n=1 Tax=Congregibacter brevis TaxID=3081201 RepID=A0ABZ0IBF3_9GAMM|nr:DUF3806 domain-containing protein [Congregibacter sp. IMCC45268]
MISILKHFGAAQTRLLLPHSPRTPITASGRAIVFTFLSGLFLAQGALAQLVDKRVTALNPLDRQYMDVQRQSLNELTLRYYGARCCRSQSELDYLQRLLDDGHVRSDQTRELQAMGVALGDLLASELEMQWVVYEDIKGRSRALRLGETENYLFPVTMIARRFEGGDRTPVEEVYQQAYEAIESVRPPLPFQ